jgi:hypothetical protein
MVTIKDREGKQIKRQLPLSIHLPDGTRIILKMITETEFGVLLADAEGDTPECLWSRDYTVSNA